MGEEGDLARPEDLESVEDGRRERLAGCRFVVGVKRLNGLGVEDGLGEEELGAGLYFFAGEAGGVFDVAAEVDGGAYAEVGCAFQGTAPAVEAVVEVAGDADEFGGGDGSRRRRVAGAGMRGRGRRRR